jgi:hypothetical protein
MKKRRIIMAGVESEDEEGLFREGGRFSRQLGGLKSAMSSSAGSAAQQFYNFPDENLSTDTIIDHALA